MCGINGVLGIKSNSEGNEIIRQMNTVLAHRGPNAEGFFVDAPICFGHRRLSIIDLSEAANQPMSDPSGRFTLIFNGEIYNFRELRKSLSEYPFLTDCDTEVLLAGLVKWGTKFIAMCNGMFAFALWDQDKEELLLARDRLGIKPLYYARTQSQFIFSSEIKGIIASGLIPGAINTEVVGEYLQYQTVHGPSTILNGVFMLSAGSLLRIDRDGEHTETYWGVSNLYDRGIERMNYQAATSMVREQLRASVKRRLVADVPMGAFLSGGIDSSAIVALAAAELKEPLKTFTVTFSEDAFSEAPYAKKVADRYSTDHRELKLQPGDLLNSLPAALAAMDHPSGDGINTYLVSKAAKEAGITVVLSGLGGDELFAGYPIFKQFYALRDKGWLMSFPKFARSLAGDVLMALRPGVASKKTKQVITEDYLDLEYVYRHSRAVSDIYLNKKLSPYGANGINAVFKILSETVGYGKPGYSLPMLGRVSVAELSTYLQNVLLRDTDAMSMAHALEVRVPFLDHELVRSVLSISDKHKYPHTPKKLLVDAMGELLPPEIVNRPKMGFTFPWDAWMKNELKDYCGDLLADLGKRDAFNQKALDSRWNAFLKGDKSVSWSRLWYLCVLEAWLRERKIA